jgi:hypothetical protein
MTDEVLKTDEISKKRGAPPGNQYARTHGFYSPVMTEEERLNFIQATEVQGLDSEIALLRVKIQSLVARDPENLKLITQVTNALCRLIMTKYNISKNDKQGLKEAIENVFRDVALPFGIGFWSILKK